EPVTAAAGASPLLAEAGDRSREADRDGGVEIADVDPELERVRRGDAEELALDEAPLDLASLLRRVSRPVRGQPLCGFRFEPINGEAVDELRRLAALREADRPEAAADEPREQPRRLAERARAQAELGVEQRWVPERDRPLGTRRGVVLHDCRLLAGQCARELVRVRDRRGGEEELRLGAVDPREPAEASQDVRDVRAEDAAVDVGLVDDDEAEVVEEVAPELVARQDADVEHVGVREDEVRPAADLAALLGRRVPVVDRGADAGNAELGERAGLILRERLRRIEIERARVAVGDEPVEDGEVEGKSLPRRGAGRDDDVPARAGGRVRLRLVRIELRDAAPRERLCESGPEPGGERRRPSRARRLGLQVRELVAGEKVVPACGGRHPTIEAGYESLNSVNCVPSGVRSRALRPPQGGTTGSASAAAPAAARRSTVASRSLVSIASRTIPETRRPASIRSTLSACRSSKSSSVARPASSRITRPSSPLQSASCRSPRPSR